MGENQVIPYWGPDQVELFNLMNQALDPERLIRSAMYALAPIEERVLLDMGAGTGDRTLPYAELASHVFALEPDPAALPILRERIESRGASNVTVVPAGAAAIPLEDNCVDVAYATWAYFFGPGSEPGLAEVERVVRSGGDLAIVQNYGHDELSRFWAPAESECESWPPWFKERGFDCEIVEAVWRFRTQDEALAVLEFLWGEPAQRYVLEKERVQFGYKVAIYHRRVPDRATGRFPQEAHPAPLKSSSFSLETLTMRYPELIVGALLVSERGEVFVARFSKIEGQYAVPGGHVEYGETVAQALIRELVEETALTPTRFRLLRVGERIRPPLYKDGSHHLVYLDFLVDRWTGELRLDGDELTDGLWVLPEAALGLPLTLTTRQAIEYYLVHHDDRACDYDPGLSG